MRRAVFFCLRLGTGTGQSIKRGPAVDFPASPAFNVKKAFDFDGMIEHNHIQSF